MAHTPSPPPTPSRDPLHLHAPAQGPHQPQADELWRAAARAFTSVVQSGLPSVNITSHRGAGPTVSAATPGHPPLHPHPHQRPHSPPRTPGTGGAGGGGDAASSFATPSAAAAAAAAAAGAGVGVGAPGGWAAPSHLHTHPHSPRQGPHGGGAGGHAGHSPVPHHHRRRGGHGGSGSGSRGHGGGLGPWPGAHGAGPAWCDGGLGVGLPPDAWPALTAAFGAFFPAPVGPPPPPISAPTPTQDLTRLPAQPPFSSIARVLFLCCITPTHAPGLLGTRRTRGRR